MQKSQRLVLLAILLVGLASANVHQITKEFRGPTFGADVLESWTVEGFNDPKISSCSGESVVGGPGIAAKASMSKVFNLEAELSEVNIQLELYLIDNWNSGFQTGKSQDQFQIFVDDVKVYQLGSDASRQLHAASQNVCGGEDKDRKTKVNLTVPVSGASFKLTFVGNMASVASENTSAWGIRELYVLGNEGVKQTVLVNELNDDDNFKVSSWTSNVDNGVSSCNGKKILGGFNVAGPGAKFERQLNNIPSHSFLTVKLDAHFIDSLDVNDSIVFYVDGKIVHEQGKNYDLAKQHTCGASWADYSQYLTFQIPHFANSALFAIYVNSDQAAGDESFGFRDFQVSVSSPCPILYTEADGQGRAFSFCGNIPNLKEVGWTTPIKGIFIPEGLSLTVYENSQYQGRKYTINSTNLNLSGNEYVLINKAFNIDINGKKLRKSA